MNIHCVTCEAIRTEATVRAGSAFAGFVCAISGERRVYLLAADDAMICHQQKNAPHAQRTDPRPAAPETHSGTAGRGDGA